MSGGTGKFLKRTLWIALTLSVLLVLAFIALDFFGEQPQPFQYLLH
jgi:hypothetical protein